MLSNSGERWLISITDIPEPRQSSSSSRMRSSTASGKAAGPALKLKTRFVAGAVTRADTFFSRRADGPYLRANRCGEGLRVRQQACDPLEYHGARGAKVGVE